MTKRILKPYKSYRFINKDPIIDKVRTAVQDSKVSDKVLTADSGVSSACRRGWFKGATKRPQYATINATLRAIGYDLKIVRKND